MSLVQIRRKETLWPTGSKAFPGHKVQTRSRVHSSRLVGLLEQEGLDLTDNPEVISYKQRTTILLVDEFMIL